MSEAQILFGVLRQSARPDFVDAIERLVRDAPDRKLGRINALPFAANEGLDEDQTIAGFLHASRLGLFELSWDCALSRLWRSARCQYLAQDRSERCLHLRTLRGGL